MKAATAMTIRHKPSNVRISFIISVFQFIVELLVALTTKHNQIFKMLMFLSVVSV